MTVRSSSATLGSRGFCLGAVGVGIVLGQSLLFGCAGRAESEDSSGGSPSGEGNPNSSTSSGGAAGVGGTEATEDVNIYRPTRTDVDYDRLLEGEAPELRQGHGWDTCATKNPGLTFEEGGADVGEFLAFRPTGGTTHVESTEAQITFFTNPYEELNEANVPLYLYFELRNLSEALSPPEGELSLALAFLCESTPEETISIPLDDLGATTNWETRCVALPPQAPEMSLNVWVTGSDFAIGIDALRFGQSCH